MNRRSAKQTSAPLALMAVLFLAFSPYTFGKGSSHGGSHSRSSGHSSGTSHSVRGYTTKKGTYVAPHRATNPNHTKNDNWSTKGNTNPYTGKKGTKDPS